jgi:hypothetical protein
MAHITKEIAALAEWTIIELRAKWHKIHGSPPPPKMSRDLLTRAAAHHLQEAALRRLDRKSERRLRTLMSGLEAGSGALPAPASALKPGTRFIREWHGRTYSVTAPPDGFEFRGKRYSSLSKIAREITGARWSGPMFFGLSSAEASHE